MSPPPAAVHGRASSGSTLHQTASVNEPELGRGGPRRRRRGRLRLRLRPADRRAAARGAADAQRPPVAASALARRRADRARDHEPATSAPASRHAPHRGPRLRPRGPASRRPRSAPSEDFGGAGRAPRRASAGELLVRALDLHARGRARLRPSSREKASPTPRRSTADDRRLDPSRPAAELERTVRALTPHVGAFFELAGGERLGVRQARAVRGDRRRGSAGATTVADGALLVGLRRGSARDRAPAAAGQAARWRPPTGCAATSRRRAWGRLERADPCAAGGLRGPAARFRARRLDRPGVALGGRPLPPRGPRAGAGPAPCLRRRPATRDDRLVDRRAQRPPARADRRPAAGGPAARPLRAALRRRRRRARRRRPGGRARQGRPGRGPPPSRRRARQRRPPARHARGTQALLEGLGDATPAEAAIRHSIPAWIAELWFDERGAEAARSMMAPRNEPPRRTYRRRPRARRRRTASWRSTSPRRGCPASAGAVAVRGRRRARLGGGRGRCRGRRARPAVARVGAGGRGARRPSRASGCSTCARPRASRPPSSRRRSGPPARSPRSSATPGRASGLRELCERAGAGNVEVLVGDALRVDAGAGYDRVLVDAPCTGLGTLAARPDARWHRRRRISTSSSPLQRDLLRSGPRRASARAAGPSTPSAPSRAPRRSAVVASTEALALPTSSRMAPDCSRARLRLGLSRLCPGPVRATASSSPHSSRRGPGAGVSAESEAVLERPTCPGCGEPWLRPTQLPGRFRCVNCMQRYELVSQCPGCGIHQTIARMKTDSDLRCQSLRRVDAEARMSAVDRSPLDGPERRVAPSILSADFARLGAQVAEVMDAGARVIHVDVMDGHFVPPITIGPLIVSAIADQVHAAGGVARLPPDDRRPRPPDRGLRRGRRRLDHLPRRGDPARAPPARRDPEAGCLRRPRAQPRNAGRAPPRTSPSSPTSLLCMTVNPGWGGQRFIAASPAKVARCGRSAPDAEIEVDGGIDAKTAPLVAEAGRRPLRRRARRSSAPTTRRRPTARSPKPPAPSEPALSAMPAR